MTVTRRAAIGGALALPWIRAARAAAPVRVGVLRFGTVAWELDVIRRRGLDAAHGVLIAPREFAAAQASQVALQAGAVDVAAQDWLWVARQRADGADWTFATFSTAIGAIVAPPGSAVASVADLKGRRLGVAGSPLDKSWLILRAYARKTLGFDPDSATERSFAPPPLLAEQAAAGRLDAVLTFWPFVARAEAAGARLVMPVRDMVAALGIAGEVPVAGYVFGAGWARDNAAAMDGFLAAAAAARAVMAHDDTEWEALAPLLGGADAAARARLRDAYRAGIPTGAEPAHAASARQLFAVLAGIGGAALVGPATELPPGTFWRG